MSINQNSNPSKENEAAMTPTPQPQDEAAMTPTPQPQDEAAIIPAPPSKLANFVDENLLNKLTEYGATEATVIEITSTLGVEDIDDLIVMTAEDLMNAGMKLAKARRLLKELQAGSSKSPVDFPATATDPPVTNPGLGWQANTLLPAPQNDAQNLEWQTNVLLPTVPNDESWLIALKTGGVKKVDDSSYIAAIHAMLADQVGLYDIPAKLVIAMEKYADDTEEQVDPVFFSLRKSLTRRNYSDIFEVIDGLDANYITHQRRKEFLERVRTGLCPAICESYQTLNNWYQAYKDSLSDPSMLFSAMRGVPGSITTISPPDASMLHDAGDTIIDAINRAFRGTGVQMGAALACDAQNIKKTLENPQLPAMIGARNREIMLKQIGAKVSSTYVRFEQNLTKYVLSFTHHDTVTSDIEAGYFSALWRLGMQIDWNQLSPDNEPGKEPAPGKTDQELARKDRFAKL